MAAANTLSFTGTITGLGSGSEAIAIGPLVNADAPQGRLVQRINATFAAVVFPGLVGSATIKGVWIIPLNGSGNITVKGITGDTGFLIHSTEPTFLRLPSVTASSFGLLTSADVTFEFLFL